MKVGDLCWLEIANIKGFTMIMEDRGMEFYGVLFDGKIRMMHNSYLKLIRGRRDENE